MDKLATYRTLVKGQGVVVSFGAHGEQYGHIVKDNGRYNAGVRTYGRQVRIWRKSSGRWTKPRLLQPAELVRLATNVDVGRFAPDFGPAWER